MYFGALVTFVGANFIVPHWQIGPMTPLHRLEALSGGCAVHVCCRWVILTCGVWLMFIASNLILLLWVKVSEGKLLMGKGMLLHQRDDADADRGYSWWLGVMDDKGNQRLEPSEILGRARMNTKLNRLKIVLLHLEVGAANGQRCSWRPEVMG